MSRLKLWTFFYRLRERLGQEAVPAGGNRGRPTPLGRLR